MIPSVAVLLVPTEPKPIFLAGAGAGTFEPAEPTCPKPSFLIPIPNRSISPDVRSRGLAADVGLSGVGAAILVLSVTLAVGLVAAAISSASGS